MPRSTCAARTGRASSGPAAARCTPPRSSSTPKTGSWPPGRHRRAGRQPPSLAKLGRMAVPGGTHVLSAEQATAVAAVVTSGRRLDVLVGAAGTGKSTTMAGVRAAWEATYGPGRGRARALGGRGGRPRRRRRRAHREHRQMAHREPDGSPEREARLRDYAARLAGAYPSPATRQLQREAAAELAAYRRWALRPGQLVIVDEASMAATPTSTRSPPSPARRERRCCWSATGHSCHRCRPAGRSSSSPTTAATTAHPARRAPVPARMGTRRLPAPAQRQP